MRFVFPLLLALSGCGGIPTFPDTSAMTAAQIKAQASIKDANVTCSEVPTPWGIARFRTLSVDRGVLQQGSVSASGEGCGMQLTNSPPQPVLNVVPQPVPQPFTPPQ